ncbi:hypothetical protein GRAN_1100 [Granulicella sibirica]|uniref:Uncharacterized protein n=1 Tax=Granulicella sibirica TaxID=2479048 RepID=A0A4Q0T5A0_9BACT|nr:hypothetical protein GRAN_1100 [Granulicella sibirica]
MVPRNPERQSQYGKQLRTKAYLPTTPQGSIFLAPVHTKGIQESCARPC